jgi:hypothetical protein
LTLRLAREARAGPPRVAQPSAALAAKLRLVHVQPERGLDPEITFSVSGIEGNVVCTQASFGPVLPPTLSAGICLALPATMHPALSNAQEAKGRILVAFRGGSSFADKALQAQAAGAVALLIVQTNPDVFPFMLDDSKQATRGKLHIPVVALSHQAGTRLQAHLERPRPLSADARIQATLCRRHDDERPCPVCHDSLLVEDEAVVQLPCSHMFHRNCLLPWLAHHPTCPNCRLQLDGAASSSGPEPAGGAVDAVALGWFG